MSQVQFEPGAEMRTKSWYKLQRLNFLQDEWLSITQLFRIYGSAISNATNPFFCSFPTIPILPSDANCVLLDLVGDGNIAAMTNRQRFHRQGELIQKNLCFLPQKAYRLFKNLYFNRPCRHSTHWGPVRHTDESVTSGNHIRSNHPDLLSILSWMSSVVSRLSSTSPPTQRKC